MNKPAPGPLPTPESLDLPETLSYRVKNKLLGPPLNTAQLRSERLGKVTALGVLAPDCISSSAYGSEEILLILVPFVGLGAFGLVVPITAAIIGVLVLVTLSYREVVQVYTRAGGSYVVARDNFGSNVAQVAAVALLIDYTVTVAVQTAAGTAALVSVSPGLLSPYTLPITVAVVVLLCYGNLRGIREAGKTFALPTYFFVVTMFVVIAVGLTRVAIGDLPVLDVHVKGAYPLGHPGGGLLMGASLFLVLKAFANGGSSLTGLEAISNGVSAFRPPEGRNARKVLVAMSATLGFLVLGVSVLAHFTHAIPYLSGAPTVISQEAKDVLGGGPVGTALYFVVQLATLLILYTGANTSFNGFPFLASFVAEDSFLPRQLTRRGHRLTFSNGIVVLAVVAIILLVATGAHVDALIAFYAIGVFTGFTMAGAGMVKHHLTNRQGRWRAKLVVNGSASVVSAAVVVIFAVTKFKQGAWAVVVLFPILVWGLIRLNRQYRSEQARLEQGAARAAEAPVLRRHAVLILVDRLDLATARAIQYARTLSPDELRAVHVVLDAEAAKDLRASWERLVLPRGLPLELQDCPDRRLVRTTLRLVAEELADGQSEVSVLLPRRAYSRAWSRFLHDRTADRIAAEVSRLPHANATIVPFQVGGKSLIARRSPEKAGPPEPGRPPGADAAAAAAGQPGGAGGAGRGPQGAEAGERDEEPAGNGAARTGVARTGAAPTMTVPGTTPIGQVRWKQRCRVAGKVTSVQVQPVGDTPRLTATVFDDSGGLTLVFGRREVPGITTGARLVAEGMVSQAEGRLAIFNPTYDFLPEDDEGAPEGQGAS